MKKHTKFSEVCTLVKHNIPVMLTGEKGSGKTTIVKQVAEELDLNFYSMSMTRQTTLSHLLGFMNVNGLYIPSVLHEAVTNGGLFLLDEIDAADANVLLSLNTIENGYVSFPTGVVECHPDFRVASTANPQDQHSHYTGRVKLDGATLDRFDIVEVPRDSDLEQTLVDMETFMHIDTIRGLLKEQNSSIIVSMRDSIRFNKRKELKLLDGFVERIVNNNPIILDRYCEKVKNLPKHANQAECQTLEDLVNLAKAQK